MEAFYETGFVGWLDGITYRSVAKRDWRQKEKAAAQEKQQRKASDQ